MISTMDVGGVPALAAKQYVLDLDHELVIDTFAGGGGASTGIEWALGRPVDVANNHDLEALGMHELNHPQTVHLPEDVFLVDPLAVTRGRRVGLVWLSPDCKHHSKAKNGKPRDQKIRGLALVMLVWAATVRPRMFVMENVEEIQKWGPLDQNDRPIRAFEGRTFRALLACMSTGIDPNHPDLPEILKTVGHKVSKEQLVKGFGYDLDGREIRASLYGAPTIRKRFFLGARCDGAPIVWPEESHGEQGCTNGKRKPVRGSHECIDWTLPCHSIFLTREQGRAAGCKRPLVKASMARIAKGVDRFVLQTAEPFIVSLTHQGQGNWPTQSLREPLKTITTAKRGEKALVAPVLANTRNGERVGQEPRVRNVTAPMWTVTAKGSQGALIAPVLSQAQHGGRIRSARHPLQTVTASTKDQNQLLAVHLTKFNTGSVGSPAHVPLPTIPAGSHAEDTRGGAATPHGLVVATVIKMRGAPESHAPGQKPSEPLHTISAGGNHHAVAAVYLAQHNGGANGHQTVGHAATEPMSAISTKGCQQMPVSTALADATSGDGELTPEQLEGARRVAQFLRAHGVSFEGEFARVSYRGASYVIVDIGMRMLTPRELFRAQGFPESYVIDRAVVYVKGVRTVVKLSKEAQIRMCGNSVCPQVAEAIVRANLPGMCASTKKAA